MENVFQRRDAVAKLGNSFAAIKLQQHSPQVRRFGPLPPLL